MTVNHNTVIFFISTYLSRTLCSAVLTEISSIRRSAVRTEPLSCILRLLSETLLRLLSISLLNESLLRLLSKSLLNESLLRLLSISLLNKTALLHHRRTCQSRFDLIGHHFIIMIFHRSQAFNVSAVETELDLVKPTVVDNDLNVKIICISESFGVVADLIALRVGGVDLVTVLDNIRQTLRYGRDRNNVRVFIRPFSGLMRRNNKVACRSINIYFFEVAVCLQRSERLELSLVLLTVCEMFFHLGNSRSPSVGHERRDLVRAVFAHVTVFELAVTEQADLFSADIAEFLVKKSHSTRPFTK